MNSTNITIIGGGACGISLFIELFLQLRIAGIHQDISISIIEENEQVGKGLAFGTRQPGHILNTQAQLMGIHHAEPTHFSDWLKEHNIRVENEVVDNQGQDEAFTTRRLYGDYLQEQFDYYFELAKKEGMKVTLLQASAIELSQLSNTFQIKLSDGNAINCKYLVLALGTPVSNLYGELLEYKNYFDSPWPSSKIIESLPKDKPVAILGSSLSAIDALMTLADNDHKGKITFYSLDGLLPRVQVEKPEPYECQYLTLSNIHKIQRTKLRSPFVSELFRLFIKEAEHFSGKKIDWEKVARKEKSAQQCLKEDIAISKAGGDALINIPYALRYESSPIWNLLDEPAKMKFKKWLGNYWAINRHCMPMVNALRIEKLFNSGQLDVVSALDDVSYDKSNQNFILSYQNKSDKFEYLINATGPAAAVKDMKSDLIQNLAQSGLIEPEKTGGVKINTETMQLIQKGKSVPNFYALGHLANGRLLDVNAVWFNVKTIGNLSHHLIHTILSENTI
ncbi:FAD/NAD(P)-binding protein [Dyadobacter subterraneus]|uniref:FAD/NAD(P)-binding protein n=1 Tax=Dyadobacter subterraneus TaxID=2773304 RepID=A0ABR9WG17_9BACT|nr:FAD/NAD(P)-binding protein [Dyadobacter subterraneus]MBE9463861.1 FAD/NAD(P)-binding protein [Dyadobacter subterraneus]